MKFDVRKASEWDWIDTVDVETLDDLRALSERYGGEDVVVCFNENAYEHIPESERRGVGPIVRCLGRRPLARPVITIYDGYLE